YHLQVTADDGHGLTTVQNITVSVAPVNDNAPVFTSLLAFLVPENRTSVGTVTATDADLPAQSVTFAITGGADAAQFSLTSNGVLTFNTAPDFDNPTDAGANNIYDLQITADDGHGRTTVRSINVAITPVND